MIIPGFFSQLIAATYTDKLSINRHVEIQNDDGTSYIALPKPPLYEGVACRISFTQSDNSDGDNVDNNPLHLQVKIFCGNGVDIKKGDKLIAHRLDDAGGILATYEGIASMPSTYVSHQEVLFSNTGVA